MKVAIASDHAGFEMKEALKPFLTSLGLDIKDLGTNSKDPVDYPDYGKKVGACVATKKAERGVLICGSGIGMCMTANRYKNVRAVNLSDIFDAEMSRKHNDANVACLGARKTSLEDAKKMLQVWFETPFEGGRYEKRVEKIEQ